MSLPELTLEIPDIPSRVRAVAEASEMASKFGFEEVEIAKIAIATAELAMNIVIHAMGKGRVTIRVVEKGSSRIGLAVTAVDEGPGIKDVRDALEGAHATPTGLGIGLGAAKRLMDDFSITTKVGRGTTVSTVKWRQQDGKAAGSGAQTARPV
jgi:serine/threonine-protein kinase RsbT